MSTAPSAAAFDPSLMAPLTGLVREAGEVILAERRRGLRIAIKRDESPVTAADHASEAVLLEGLARLLPGVPIVSEEQRAAGDGAGPGALFVLVDPLDGTRDFINGHDEFTVNVAIVIDGRAVAGIVGAPACGTIWRGLCGGGAERLSGTGCEPIRTRRWRDGAAIALASRSHLDAASAALLARLGLVPRPCGSSLKFCRLAEGAADFYPRLAPTSQWDIAAGHALLAAAGGNVVTPAGCAVTYGAASQAALSPPSLLVPAFLACGDPAVLPALIEKSAPARAAQ